MLQLQAMGRELNEGDFDVLSQLDHYNSRDTTERVTTIVNQLPTYLYRNNTASHAPKDQDEAAADEDECKGNSSSSMKIS